MNTTNTNVTKIVLASDLVEGKYYKLANFKKVTASPHSSNWRNVLKTYEFKLSRKRASPVDSDEFELVLDGETPQGTRHFSMLVKPDQEFVEKKPAAGAEAAAGQNGGRKSRKNTSKNHRKNRRMTRNKRR